MPDTLILYRNDADTTGLDLSGYVDVDRGGITFGDEGARTPVWSQGALGYGERLIQESLANSSITVRLLLSAANRGALDDLQADIELRLRDSRPVVAWTPEGATLPTWFAVRYGRLLTGARYQQKLERTSYARRDLVLIVDPFGTGMRNAAASLPVAAGPTGPGWASVSASGGRSGAWAGISPSNPFVGQLPSVGGDTDVRWRFGFSASAPSIHASAGSSSPMFPGRVVIGFTDRPFTPFQSASGAMRTSTALGPTTLLADPFAPGGVALEYVGTLTGTLGDLRQPPAFDYLPPISGWQGTAHAGGAIHRVFACIRVRQATAAGSNVQALAQLKNESTQQFGPVATLAARAPSAWLWYDMGDVADPGGVAMTIRFAYPSGATWAAGASFPFNLAGLCFIPRSERGYVDIVQTQLTNRLNAAVIVADSEGPVAAVGAAPGGPGIVDSVTGVVNQLARGAAFGQLPITAPGTPPWAVGLLINYPDVSDPSRTSVKGGLERVVMHAAAVDRYTFAR